MLRHARSTAAQPKVVSAGRIFGDVVVGGQGAGVDRQRADDRAVKGVDRRADTTPLTACEPAKETGTSGVPQ